MGEPSLKSNIKLPCGVVLKNRLVKSAMTERISNKDFEPTDAHITLYKRWSKSNAGLLISGNVMVDRKHIESAGNICFDDEEMLPKLRSMAEAGKSYGNHFWVQISHAGRQTNKFNASRPLAPSEVKLNKIGLFGYPRAMTEEDILKTIEGYVKASVLAKKAGFTGVQIHAAHGYLISQFLSPKTNIRKDQWGGTVQNRSRLLITILKEVRERVGPDFPISVKLNSSDFQRGGFSEDDSLEVVKMLDKEKVDLLEISGGTYEKVAFFLLNKDNVKESTKKREAYFIDFAKKVRRITNIPLLITGGFRSKEFCEQVLKNNELDLIGMARPFISNVDEIKGFLIGEIKNLDNIILRTGIKQFEDSAEGGFYARQLIRIARGKPLKKKMNPMICAGFLLVHEFKKALRKKIKL